MKKYNNVRLLFDLKACQPVGTTKRHGGGIYGEIIFRRIVERELPVACFYDSRKWISPDIMSIIRRNRIKTIDVSEKDLESVICENEFDILYSPIYQGVVKEINTCQVVTTIHGLRLLETPTDLYQLKYSIGIKEIIKYYLKRLFPRYWNKRIRKYYRDVCLKKNLRFVTVSNHSRASYYTYFPDLLRHVDIPVFYSPNTITASIIDDRKYTEKYFLLVSANRWDKNNLRAIMAFDNLFSEGYLQDAVVKITGTKSEKSFKYKIKNSEKFEFLGYVSDADLRQLYHDAYCFVYPSLNEGFGYPPIEAMFYGTPVIASSYSSIPEVCGDAVMYCNPLDIKEIENRIFQMNDSAVHDKYSKRSKSHYQKVRKKQDEDLDKLIDYIYSFV